MRCEIVLRVTFPDGKVCGAPPTTRIARLLLTNEQRDRLTRVPEAVPIDERFKVIVFWPQINGVQRYANEVQEVFSSAKWEAKVSAAGLTFGQGMSFVFNQQACDDKTNNAAALAAR